MPVWRGYKSWRRYKSWHGYKSAAFRSILEDEEKGEKDVPPKPKITFFSWPILILSICINILLALGFAYLIEKDIGTLFGKRVSYIFLIDKK